MQVAAPDAACACGTGARHGLLSTPCRKPSMSHHGESQLLAPSSSSTLPQKESGWLTNQLTKQIGAMPPTGRPCPPSRNPISIKTYPLSFTSRTALEPELQPSRPTDRF